MGRARAKGRRAGIRREGPVERARIEGVQEHAREHQRQSRRHMRENAHKCVRVTVEEESTSEVDNYYVDGVNRRLVRRDVAQTKLQLFVCHSFVAKWEDEQFRTCLRTSSAYMYNGVCH
jgi:hypothetical protein